MEQIKLEEQEVKDIQGLNEEKNQLTVEFGKIRMDLIIIKAKLMEFEKLDSDMEARFKGNETKGRKMMEKLNKKYGVGSIDIKSGMFTPAPKQDGEEKR